MLRLELQRPRFELGFASQAGDKFAYLDEKVPATGRGVAKGLG